MLENAEGLTSSMTARLLYLFQGYIFAITSGDNHFLSMI